MATTINLKDYYYWYTHDEFMEVSDEVSAELEADKRYERTHQRNMRRYRVHSLDAEDGAEESAIVCYNDSPERLLDMMERHCGLCRALNSLPEIQGRRIEARYLLGKSVQEIARTEGVSESSVKESLDRGLRAMKKFLSRNFENCPAKCL